MGRFGTSWENSRVKSMLRQGLMRRSKIHAFVGARGALPVLASGCWIDTSSCFRRCQIPQGPVSCPPMEAISAATNLIYVNNDVCLAMRQARPARGDTSPRGCKEYARNQNSKERDLFHCTPSTFANETARVQNCSEQFRSSQQTRAGLPKRGRSIGARTAHFAALGLEKRGTQVQEKEYQCGHRG